MQFQQIIGQSLIKQKLIQTVHTGRISHTQLFLGPEGSGALALALAYVQFINCNSPLPDDSCGNCPSCVKFEKLIHPDLHFTFPIISNEKKRLSNDYLAEWRHAFLENPYLSEFQWLLELDEEGKKQGNITANECRDIIRKLSLKAFEAKYKAIIIWLPEYMKQEGNILLKLLEEPPEGTLILMVAQDSDKLLATILSRAQTIKIPRLNEEDIETVLINKHGITKAEAENISLLSEGNILTAYDLASAERSDYQALFSEWMRAIYARELPKINTLIEKIIGSGREFVKSFLGYSLHMMRSVLLSRHGDEKLIRLSQPEKAFIEKFSVVFDDRNIEEIVLALNQTSFYVERNADLRITFLNLSLYISRRLVRQKAAAN